MRIDWVNFKKFLDDTKLFHFLNYMELVNDIYVWYSYQGENFNCLLAKGSASWEDFDTNYKTKAILKNDINQDGISMSKARHVTLGRFFHSLFVVVTTCNTTNNDITGLITIKLLDESGNETTVKSEVVKTCVDFHPDFTYELYGGGLQILDDPGGEIYINSILNPDSTDPIYGKIKLIINKLVISQNENIFKSATIPGELPYIQGQQTNYLRIELTHPKGEEIRGQIEIQYYS